MVRTDKMMRKRLLIISFILALLGTPIVALASNINFAQYYGIIQITNNSTATTNVATTCNISTQNLIDGNYLNASANNCVVRTSSGADVPFMPSVNATYPWGIWVPSIGDYSAQSDILYTANSTGGLISYFPGSGGMTTTDNDTLLELGDNFTVEQSGWIDTDNGTDKNLIYKANAFRTYISGTGNITSLIDIWASPTSHSDPDGTWSTETLAYDGLTATKAYETIAGGGNWGKFLYLYVAGEATNEIRYWLNRTQVGIDIIDIDLYYNDGWQALYDGAPALTAWETVAIGSTVSVNGTRFRAWNTGVPAGDIYLYEFAFGQLPSVTATGVSSGNHTVKTTQGTTDGGHIYCSGDGDYIDCGDSDSLSAATMLSVECWMKGTTPTVFSSYKIFASKYYHATAREWVFFTYRTGGYDELNFAVFDQSAGASRGGKVPSTDNISIWDGVAHHVAVTWDGDISNPCTGITFYIDGVSANYTDLSAGAFTAIEDTTQPVYIGRQGNLTTRDWRDYIDSVRIYNRELSAAEVAQHFAGTFTDESSLVGLWHIDEDSGTTVWDASGEDNTGTIMGGTLTRQANNLSGQTNSILEIYVDNVLKDIAGATTVPNTTDNWTFLQNDAMPYMDYQKIWIGGVLRQYIEWEYDTTFTDLSGNNNDATPSFRAASSDADVSAELVSFLPIAEAKAPAYVLGEAPAFINPAITGNTTGTFTTTPGAGTFPLAGVITAIANATATPPQLPLLIIACFIILAASLSISAVMRRYGSGSIIVKIFVVAAVTGVFIALKNFGFDYWMLYVFLVIATALAMASRQYGWS